MAASTNRPSGSWTAAVAQAQGPAHRGLSHAAVDLGDLHPHAGARAVVQLDALRRDGDAPRIHGQLVLEHRLTHRGRHPAPVGVTGEGAALDQAAAATYRRKKFKPSVGPNGPITVKFYQPVRFVLE